MKSAEVMWGIVILVVAGGITLITYVAATPGGTYFLAYGAIIWGAYKVLRGLGSASVFWRIVGLATMAAMVVVGVLVFQDSRNLSDLYNSTHVGECVDLDGLATECDRFDAKPRRSCLSTCTPMIWPSPANRSSMPILKAVHWRPAAGADSFSLWSAGVGGPKPPGPRLSCSFPPHEKHGTAGIGRCCALGEWRNDYELRVDMGNVGLESLACV